MEILLNSFGVGLLLLCKGVPLSLVYTSSEIPLGKSNSTFASGCQLETASRLRIGAHIYSPLWWDSVYSATISVISYQTIAHGKYCFLGVILPLWLLQSFCLNFRITALTFNFWALFLVLNFSVFQGYMHLFLPGLLYYLVLQRYTSLTAYKIDYQFWKVVFKWILTQNPNTKWGHSWDK